MINYKLDGEKYYGLLFLDKWRNSIVHKCGDYTKHTKLEDQGAYVNFLQIDIDILNSKLLRVMNGKL